MHLPLLQDMLILLGFSVAIVFVLQKLKLPSIIGFLLTGVLIGPHGFSLIKAVEQVEILSEIGVILLLFVIGLELSIKQLVSIKKTVIVGGFLQVALSVLVTSIIYHFLRFSWEESVFVGFLFSLSSTAIVLKTLQDRQEISAPHGRNALAILIFQDIIVVPMMLITPLIARETTDIWQSVISLIGKTFLVLSLTYVGAKYLVNRLLFAVAKTNSKELFLLVVITLCFAVAFLTSEAGLSLALGAFIAGLVISESEYRYQSTSIILPFRELFTSFFFVSVGMLLDLSFFFQNLSIVLVLLLVVFLFKSTIASIAVAVLGYPKRTVLLTGLSLFQVGEFAFVLSKVGVKYNLLTEETNQYFLSVSILSMIITPFVIIFSEKIANKFLGVSKKIGLENKFSKNSQTQEKNYNNLENHLVIIGYGINGSNLAKAALSYNIPFVVVEMDADLVKKEKAKGIPILYGDATEDHILETINLPLARAVVIAISDNKASKTIIKNIRSVSETIYLVVRTRFVKQISELEALGADKVIPEEYETSIQIFSNILKNFLVPEDEIENLVKNTREDNYKLFLNEKRKVKNIEFSDFKISCLKVATDSNKFLGKPVKELNLKTEFGVNLLAISRNDKMLDEISKDEILKQGDKIYLQGDSVGIEKLRKIVS